METEKKMIDLKFGEWFWLDREDMLLGLISAEVELYIVLPNQRRIFIHELCNGDFMVGLPSVASKIRLLALTTKAGQASVSNWKKDMLNIKMMDSILQIFLKGIQQYLNLRVYEVIDANETKEIAEAVFLKNSPIQKLLWIYIEAGDLILCGAREGHVKQGDFTIIGENVWIKSVKPAKIKAYTTAELIRCKGKETFLELFTMEQIWFLSTVADVLSNQQEAERAKIHFDKKLDDTMLKYAVHELLKNDVKPLPPVIERNEQNMPMPFIVARIIAQNMGISEPRRKLFNNRFSSTSQRDIVQAAANSFGMVERKVHLKRGWHKGDHGELMVFIDEKPYGVISMDEKRYELIDPQTETIRIIDDALAEKISPYGYSFYPQLSMTVNSIKKWFAWSLKFCWKRDLWILLLACLIAGIIPILTPFITQMIFEYIIPTYDKKAHLIIVQVMFVAACVNTMVSFVRGIAVLRIKNKMHVVSESALWLRLLALPTRFFRQYSTGDLAKRMQGVSQIYVVLSTALASGIFNGLFSFWNIIVMIYYSWKLALVAILFWAVYFLIAFFFSVRFVNFYREKTTCMGKVAGQTVQLFGNISKFRVQASETRPFTLWAEKFRDEWFWNRKARWQQNWLDLLNAVMSIGVLMLFYWITIYWMDAGLKENTTFLSQADFLGFNAALSGFGIALMGLFASLSNCLEIIPLGERIKPILKAKPENDDACVEAGELSGSIFVDHVNFRYGENKPLVLKDVSFSVSPGEFIAIVGRSGCGKSTLIRLLLGFEKAEIGGIFYDGFSLSKVSSLSIRRQIGACLQHGQLLAGSILDNIVGALSANRDEAMEAAILAGLGEDLKEMPMGIDTIISEGANNISGGQRQRILIARAIFSRPRIIIFDEATSALDNHTQSIVSETLKQLKATRIVVAHRLSTIEQADRILVMEDGCIVEEGKLKELIEKNGIFTDLVKRQIV